MLVAEAILTKEDAEKADTVNKANLVKKKAKEITKNAEDIIKLLTPT